MTFCVLNIYIFIILCIHKMPEMLLIKFIFPVQDLFNRKYKWQCLTLKNFKDEQVEMFTVLWHCPFSDSFLKNK